MKNRLARRWFDISSKELPRELGSLRPRDFDLLPFGTYRLDRDGTIRDWIPDEQSRTMGRRLDELRGRSFFNQVNPCFFIRDFQEELFDLFIRDEFDETFFFTFRFPGEWRQARLRVSDDGSGIVTLEVTTIRRIADGDRKGGQLAEAIA